MLLTLLLKDIYNFSFRLVKLNRRLQIGDGSIFFYSHV